jgi:hypothetical protein
MAAVSDLTSLHARPGPVAAEADFAPWFGHIAGRLLNSTDFLVSGKPYRFAELEAYYHGPAHPDPFGHRDPLQREPGRWYFHRTGGRYRGGTFKGLDLTLGDGSAYLGVLIRSIVAPDGTFITGPCRTVDHLLADTGTKSVAALDGQINARPVWDTSSPLAVRDSPIAREAVVYTSARVGLSLKRAVVMTDGAVTVHLGGHLSERPSVYN